MIVSGRSGSGKSIALRALEDMGFYCVDNIPITLFPELAKTLENSNTPVAVSIDIRRYSETRRTHPLSLPGRSLEQAIELEDSYLEPLKDNADLIINTDNLSVHELSDILRQRILGKKERELTIIFESFGFKYGLPIESDFVFDVRFLPNPHWELNLRQLTGLDQPVQNYLTKHTQVINFIQQTATYLQQWLPHIKKNNRSYLTISIGCTGGQHRSVFIAEKLAELFILQGEQVQTRHRSLEKKLHKN